MRGKRIIRIILWRIRIKPYCIFVINPKVQKFRKSFRNKLRGEK